MRCTSPASPDLMDWAEHYPAYVAEADGSQAKRKPLKRDVTVADIGCGFGGLLVALAPKLPDELLIGRFLGPHFLRYEKVDQVCRHGNTNTGHRIRARPHQSTPKSERRHRALPERSLPPRQHHEIPAQLLSQGTIDQDVPLFSRSAFQSPQAQSSDRLHGFELGVRLCDETRRDSVYNHRR